MLRVEEAAHLSKNGVYKPASGCRTCKGLYAGSPALTQVAPGPRLREFNPQMLVQEVREFNPQKLDNVDCYHKITATPALYTGV